MSFNTLILEKLDFLNNKVIFRNDKKRLLFIPAAVRSHILPTFYVAQLLQDEFDIFYAVSNSELANMIIKNGFTPLMYRPSAFQEDNQSYWWHSIRNNFHDERKLILKKLIDFIEPKSIIIDIFNTDEFLLLYQIKKKALKLVFYNPMMSIYKIDGFPTISESNWPRKFQLTNKQRLHNYDISALELNNLFKKKYLMWQLKRKAKVAKLSNDNNILENLYLPLFNNVTELILAPLEFEFWNKVNKPYQFYLGLCIQQNRTDVLRDENFSKKWSLILNKVDKGERLIYCSFGTFYSGSDKKLLNFIKKLINVAELISNIQLVISVNYLVIETINSQCIIPNNIHLFHHVPQLTVLKYASLYISHGGLGSIKESIYYGVPLLIYPLITQNDQSGNALKVEYHKLGMRGSFVDENEEDLFGKINILLNDVQFRLNVIKLQRYCSNEYSDERIKQLLVGLL